MDLYKLYNGLKRLNALYWNEAIEKGLQDAGHPNDTPQDSAFYRHVIAIRDKMNRARISEAMLEVQQSLAPYSEDVERILREVGTSPIPAGQLASAIAESRDFVGVSIDTYRAAIEFAVCFSHDQFLSDLTNYLHGPEKTRQGGKPSQKTKKRGKVKKPEKKYRPWTRSGDACFIVEEVKYKPSNSRIKDIMCELAALEDVHIRPGRHAPSRLDGTLNPEDIIAANNCLLDISTHPPKPLPLSGDFYTLNPLGIDHDSTALPPRFKKFLGDIFFIKTFSDFTIGAT